MDLEFVLHLLEHEYLDRRSGEPANAHLLDFVIFEERFGSHQLPSTVILQLFDDLIIPKGAHIAEASCKDYIAALLAREEHFLKQ